MKKTTLGCLGILVILILAFSIFLNLILLANQGSSPAQKTYEEELLEGELGFGQSKIAVIDLYGVISYGAPGEVKESMVADFIAKLKQAKKDPFIKAIIVRIDSPGGEVTASDTIYHEIKKCRKVKPIIAYMQSVGASGAYYAAMGTDYIITHDTTITASIGVVIQAMNFQRLSEKIGVSSLTIKSGKMKDMLNPFREAQPEEIAYVQSLIDDTYSKFVGIVAESRNIDEEKLRNGVADGRIVNGSTALAEGLIDATGYFEDAIAKAREKANLGSDAPVIRLSSPINFGRLLRIFGKAPETSNKVELHLTPETYQLEPGKMYFLPAYPFAQ